MRLFAASVQYDSRGPKVLLRVIAAQAVFL